jgi:hypothetical protein
MTIKITPNDHSNPPGKLADAELHFTDGLLDGLNLIGFSIWERRTGGGRNVMFPARQYAVVSGDRLRCSGRSWIRQHKIGSVSRSSMRTPRTKSRRCGHDAGCFNGVVC